MHRKILALIKYQKSGIVWPLGYNIILYALYFEFFENIHEKVKNKINEDWESIDNGPSAEMRKRKETHRNLEEPCWRKRGLAYSFQ